MILAIDFDNTVHDINNPVEGKKMGKPMPGAVEAIENLVEAGHTVIIHTLMATSPSGAKVVSEWLEFYDVPHHGVTAIKPRADVYLDDKGVRFINWKQALQDMEDICHLNIN